MTKKRVMLFRKFVCGFRNNMTRFPNHEICFQNSQRMVSRQHVGLYVESKLHGYVDSRFACFYLTRQLESILRKFQLAGVVLVVSKPHVFNLTGQLVKNPPPAPGRLFLGVASRSASGRDLTRVPKPNSNIWETDE